MKTDKPAEPSPEVAPMIDPCPFCGVEPEETHANDLSYYYVGCANEYCMVQPETGLENSEEKARAAWNWKDDEPAAQPAKHTDDLEEMSDEGLDAELRANGIDPEEAERNMLARLEVKAKDYASRNETPPPQFTEMLKQFREAKHMEGLPQSHAIYAYEQDFLQDGEVAVCACGWRSKRGSMRQIRAWHQNHQAKVNALPAKEKT